MSLAENASFSFALDLINETSHSIFLTGKAGTGKTTFLHIVRQQTNKNTIVVAPTGVAAINAGGVTIHSFFQLPLTPFLPQHNKGWGNGIDKHGLLSKIRMGKDKADLLQKLELLIIDEVSMVRCDVLDAIDVVLRHVRRRPDQPFGGLQVLLIGDLYQLSPVIREEDWALLKNIYDGPFFFQSKVFEELNPSYIELDKVYRQQDERFIGLLNKIRTNHIDAEDLDQLNQRFNPGNNFNADDEIITLTTHNRKAESINLSALRRLPGLNKTYEATIIGEFNENSYPADINLELKTGAQVMFIRNDSEKFRRFYNGKIGRILELGNDSIVVECLEKDGSRQQIEVKRESWRNIRYTLNTSSKQIDEIELGSFSQFPLRLAWAITIHKSQGLTFDKLIIDAGDSFAPGQVYVALSRCTSLEGIQLCSRIIADNIKQDERINRFVHEQSSRSDRTEELRNAKIVYERDVLNRCFDFSAYADLISRLQKEITEHLQPAESVTVWLNGLINICQLSLQHGQSFIKEMNGYDAVGVKRSDSEILQARIKKASAWFATEWGQIREQLLMCPVRSDNREFSRRLNNQLIELFYQANLHLHQFNELLQGFEMKKFLASALTFSAGKFPLDVYAGKSNHLPADIANPILYLSLSEKRNELAREKAMPVYMICSTQSLEQMSAMLPLTPEALLQISGFGEVKLRQYGNIFLSIIQEYTQQHGLESLMTGEPKEKKKKKSQKEPRKKNDSKLETLAMIREGKTLAEVAVARGMVISTIEGHVAYFIEQGLLPINDFVTQHQQEIIRNTMQKYPEITTLGKLKEILPDFEYREIKMVLADDIFRKAGTGVSA